MSRICRPCHHSRSCAHDIVDPPNFRTLFVRRPFPRSPLRASSAEGIILTPMPFMAHSVIVGVEFTVWVPLIL